MPDDLLSLAADIDNPYTAGAVVIAATLALLWRFLDKKLQSVASRADDAVNNTAVIREEIRTNHGSKNLGDAIDRLTEHSFIQLELWSKTDKRVRSMSQDFLAHIEESTAVSDWVRKKMHEEELAEQAMEPHQVADEVIPPLETFRRASEG